MRKENGAGSERRAVSSGDGSGGNEMGGAIPFIANGRDAAFDSGGASSAGGITLSINSDANAASGSSTTGVLGIAGTTLVETALGAGLDVPALAEPPLVS
jgi:hypothetical protein